MELKFILIMRRTIRFPAMRGSENLLEIFAVSEIPPSIVDCTLEVLLNCGFDTKDAYIYQ